MLMQAEPNVTVVGEAVDGHEAQRLCQALNPDVVLLDQSIPGPSSLDTMTLLNDVCPETKVILLSDCVQPVPIQDFLALGLSGYVLHDDAVEAVVHAVRAAAEGKTWFSQAAIQQMIRPAMQKPALEAFTPREVEVLRLLVRGWSNLRIASSLDMSERTVRHHLQNISSKLNVTSRNEVLAWAIENNLGSHRV
jgi:DNA-binding NarL/FixJ family response regulator